MIHWPISFGPVEVVQTTPDHLVDFWDILRGWGTFWADKGRIHNLERFVDWYGQIAKDSLTGLEGDQVVGGAYLDAIYPNQYATANIFKRQGYLNPHMVAAVVKNALPYWFEKYNLEAVRGITRQRSSIMLARRIGFKKDGTLRHWARVNGEWTDYTMLSILRSEL